MTEDDFGVALRTTFSGADLTSGTDIFRFTFKKEMNGEPILIKDFSTFVDNAFDFVLSQENSAKFPVGSYVFSVDWIQNGSFKCTLVEKGIFKVGDEA